MDSRRLCDWGLLPDETRDRLIDAAHQVARMSPTMYLRWLFARGIETQSFSGLLIHRSKVRGALEIRFFVPRFSASNPKQSRQVHSRSRERNRIERIRNINERTCLLPFRSLRKQ